MLRCILQKVTKRQDLSERDCAYIVEHIMKGRTEDVQLSALLAALTTKGVKENELYALAVAMRQYSKPVHSQRELFDIVGTGGGSVRTFNISTTAAFVIAAGGVAVAKHGTRAKASRSGSADVLEALGANIFLSPESCCDMVRQIGLCYFYTRYYYYTMKQVDKLQRQLGIETVWDRLRPISNPASITRQVLGVSQAAWVEPMAHVLSRLGIRKGMVVHGRDGTDELSAAANTLICEFSDGQYKTYEICPEQFSLQRCDVRELQGGTPKENAAITRRVLQGEKGPCRMAILLNAGAGLYIGGASLTLAAGIKRARQLIDSGIALEKLEDFIVMSQNMGKIEKVKIATYQDDTDMV